MNLKVPAPILDNHKPTRRGFLRDAGFTMAGAVTVGGLAYSMDDAILGDSDDGSHETRRAVVTVGGSALGAPTGLAYSHALHQSTDHEVRGKAFNQTLELFAKLAFTPDFSIEYYSKDHEAPSLLRFDYLFNTLRENYLDPKIKAERKEAIENLFRESFALFAARGEVDKVRKILQLDEKSSGLLSSKTIQRAFSEAKRSKDEVDACSRDSTVYTRTTTNFTLPVDGNSPVSKNEINVDKSNINETLDILSRMVQAKEALQEKPSQPNTSAYTAV